MKYEAIIFDLFGTLIDTSSRAAYEKVLREMADVLHAPADKFTQLWFDTFTHRATGELESPGGNIRHICEKLVVTYTEEQLKEAIRLRFTFTADSLVPRKDAIDLLRELKSRGYRIGLISDCSGEVPVLWQNVSLAPYIDVPLFSCSVGMRKPDPRIYRMATEQLGVRAEKCLYVGDGSSQELTGAQKAGMQPVLIRVPYERTSDSYRIDEEEWAGPTISSLGEVLDLL